MPFLEGLLAAETIPLELPSVEVIEDIYVDIHILTGEGGDWILKLDATAVALGQREMQQKINEAALLNGGEDQAGGDVAWQAVFPTLNMALMLRTGDHEFDLISGPPVWLIKLWTEAVKQRHGVRPGEGFPFLEYFLVEAETFWESASSGQLASGYWSEADQQGKEYQLEATAMAVDNVKLLLVSYPEQVFHDRQEILQKSREISLTHGRTLQEI